MTFDIMRVTIKGDAPGGEVWSINPVYAFGDFAQPTPTFSQMAAAASAVAELAPGAAALTSMSSALRITGARLEARQSDGSLEVVGEALRATPLGGSVAANKPYQTSLVLSLRSGAPGARGRGRLYWPACAATMVTSTMRLDSTLQGTLRTALSTYLVAIGDAMEAPLSLSGSTLVVWSRTSTSINPVISTQLGDVFDTQRRRRDSAIETYATGAYP